VAAGLGGFDLDLQEPLQGGGDAELVGAGGVEHAGQGFGGVVELEVGQVGAQLLVAAGLTHRGGGGAGRGRGWGGHEVSLAWWR
jgi:hypothetical protein